MLNQVILIGRLTRDPDLGYTQSGVARCRFTLAVDRAYKGADGTKQTDFIDIVAWRKLAEICNRYLRKGLMTCVVGSLQIRSYETQDGQKRRVAEINAEDVRFLEWPQERQSVSVEVPEFGDPVKAAMETFDGVPLDDDLGDLPF